MFHQAFLSVPRPLVTHRQTSFSQKCTKNTSYRPNFLPFSSNRCMCNSPQNSNQEDKDTTLEKVTSGSAASGATIDDPLTTELDQLAEEWIGPDISRWEWYERMKTRRQRLRRSVVRQQAEFDRELEQLHHALMEFDAVFGTSMLNEESKLTPLAWFTIFVVMGLYVVLGYTIFEVMVHMAMDMDVANINSSPW